MLDRIKKLLDLQKEIVIDGFKGGHSALIIRGRTVIREYPSRIQMAEYKIPKRLSTGTKRNLWVLLIDILIFPKLIKGIYKQVGEYTIKPNEDVKTYEAAWLNCSSVTPKIENGVILSVDLEKTEVVIGENHDIKN